MNVSWREFSLADAGVAVLDCEHKTPKAVNDGLPYIAIPDLRDGRIDLDGARRITREDFIEWTRRHRPQGGDLVVTRRGRVGDSAPIPSNLECAIGQNLVILRSDGSYLDQSFLQWLARSPAWWQEVGRMINVGAVFSSLNVRDFSRFRFAIPPLREQRAIAAVLGALDDKVAANQHVAASSRSVALAIASRAELTVQVSAVADHRRQQIVPANMTDDLVHHFSLPAYDTGFGPEAVAPTEIKSAKFAVTSPSVLVSKLNPRFPRIWDVPVLRGRQALASTEFVVLEPHGISTALLWALLAQPAVGAELEAQVSGTSGSHQRVKPEAVLAARIGDPAGISDDDRATVEGCVTRAHAVLEENLRLTAIRDALLPALMSGRLTVRDAERVVADAT